MESELTLTKDVYYGYLLGGLTKYYRVYTPILDLDVNFMINYRKMKFSQDVTSGMVQYSVRYLQQEVR